MEKSTTTLIGIIFAALFIVLAVITFAGMSYPNGFAAVGVPIASDYEYSVTVLPTGDLTNVSLLIPLPADNTGSDIGTPLMLTDASDYPEDWNLVLVGNPGEPTYLKITTPLLPAALDGQGTRLQVTIPSDALIPTITPEDGAYLFGVSDRIPDTPGADASGKIFAKYSADPSTETDITVSCTGENTWWWFRNGSNAYTDRLSTEIRGPVSGWQKTTGDRECGTGTYTII